MTLIFKNMRARKGKGEKNLICYVGGYSRRNTQLSKDSPGRNIVTPTIN